MTPEAALNRPIDAIVIGASAGGIEGLSAILPPLRRGLPAAVFVVLHIPRDKPSLLVEVFGPKCGLSVREAADKEPIEPGTVYFAPPDYHLLVDSGDVLSLSSDEPVNFSRPSIDVLFESAADRYRERLVGVILSGASHDGAAGLAAIRDAGGVTIVQEPDDEIARVMPDAAIAAVTPDFVLPLDAIARLFEGL